VVRITVRDGVRISNRVRGRVKLVNYSLITTLPIATSAHLLFTRGPTFSQNSSDYSPFNQFLVGLAVVSVT